MTSPNWTRGHHAELGDLFAAWDWETNHIEPGVRASRFSARLAPFRTKQDAERALIDMGAVLEARSDDR